MASGSCESTTRSDDWTTCTGLEASALFVSFSSASVLVGSTRQPTNQVPGAIEVGSLTSSVAVSPAPLASATVPSRLV
ncbi:MAG: hypothetical protein MUC96_38095, partial [Myxococcaceae bacterium]|nr:hypothetical protein [Myxococcaceae bacterium]